LASLAVVSKSVQGVRLSLNPAEPNGGAQQNLRQAESKGFRLERLTAGFEDSVYEAAHCALPQVIFNLQAVDEVKLTIQITVDQGSFFQAAHLVAPSFSEFISSSEDVGGRGPCTRSLFLLK
jgi:hypothetical protein